MIESSEDPKFGLVNMEGHTSTTTTLQDLEGVKSRRQGVIGYNENNPRFSTASRSILIPLLHWVYNRYDRLWQL
jgi:hypothetical protein